MWNSEPAPLADLSRPSSSSGVGLLELASLVDGADAELAGSSTVSSAISIRPSLAEVSSLPLRVHATAICTSASSASSSASALALTLPRLLIVVDSPSSAHPTFWRDDDDGFPWRFGRRSATRPNDGRRCVSAPGDGGASEGAWPVRRLIVGSESSSAPHRTFCCQKRELMGRRGALADGAAVGGWGGFMHAAVSAGGPSTSIAAAGVCHGGCGSTCTADGAGARVASAAGCEVACAARWGASTGCTSVVCNRRARRARSRALSPARRGGCTVAPPSSSGGPPPSIFASLSSAASHGRSAWTVAAREDAETMEGRARLPICAVGRRGLVGGAPSCRCIGSIQSISSTAAGYMNAGRSAVAREREMRRRHTRQSSTEDTRRQSAKPTADA